ncbi:MAG: cyclic nucleotide-binding domain-containing protein [Bdellovibrionia bacterium]
MYFINNGAIEILGGDGSLLATLGDGSFFGEMALISDGLRNATARASAYSNVYVLSKESFQHVVTVYPEFQKNIQEVTQQRKTKTA